MRKKTIKNVADTIFWYSLYMLPVIVFLVSMFQLLGNESYVAEYLSVDGNTGDLFYTIFNISTEFLRDWVGNLGITSIFQDILSNANLFVDCVLFDFVSCYLIYFIIVYIMHVCVDFLLFIPRLAHKWMNSFTRED